MKYFFTIAASDNSGGAGIQQDLKVARYFNFWGLSAITGLTVQNFNKVEKIYPVSANILKEQIEININSFKIDALKIGAICSDENIALISDILKKYKLNNIVLDTVFAPTQGKEFIKKQSIDLFIEKLFKYVNLITPNKKELSLLCGKKINTLKQGIETAKKISEKYGCYVFIKGGHFNGNNITEALIQHSKVTHFEKERLNITYSHGTGCTFSSALCCCLATGSLIEEACYKATVFVNSMYKAIEL